MTGDLSSRLQSCFGFSSFRPGQEEAIRSLLKGEDTLAIMPTGAGKSLIYQFTALQLGGLSLVISPLIALMKDQVDSLCSRGIPAAFINSAIPGTEQRERLAQLAAGGYRLVYVAPERLRNVSFLRALETQTISLLAVDEAHCISEWGHDFRPDYLHIAEACKQLKNPLTVALTATATPQVQDDIIRLLQLPASTRRVVTGFNRPNLSLEVVYTTNPESKLRAVSQLLHEEPSGASLIYTGTRRDAEETAEFVRSICGIKAEHYHAGLLPAERTRIQAAFMTGSTPVICATNAFGMGIDRADVRRVIHFSLPGSLEAYYQEAGRAGRDGFPAKAVLLYDPKDRALQEFFISSGCVSPRELRALYQALGNEDSSIWMTPDDFSRRTDLDQVKVRLGLDGLERAGALERLGDDGFRMLLQKGRWEATAIEQAARQSEQHMRHRGEQLVRMVHYAETNDCRRRIILKHFGDSSSPEAAICCDNCQSKKGSDAPRGDATVTDRAGQAALVILDAARRLDTRRVGREKLAQILHGSNASDIRKFHYDQAAYYGKLDMFRQSEIEDMIEQIIGLGFFKIIGGQYPVLSLTPSGEAAIRNKMGIPIKLPQGFSAQAAQQRRSQRQAGGTVEYTGQLIRQGLRPEAIAQERGLTLNTIHGHCARLIEAGSLDINQVLTTDILQKIKAAVEKVGSTEFLFPIKSELSEEISYEMIRCMLASQGGNPKTAIQTAETSSAHEPIQHIVARGESRSAAAVPELIEALKSSNTNTRRLAASALGKIGSAQALDPLLELLSLESKPQVRQYAVKALGSIGDARALPALARICEDENEPLYTRHSAKRAILACQHRASSELSPAAVKQPIASSVDPIAAYLASPHARALRGPWHAGFALDFHSSYAGADWNRSIIGDLTYRLKYQSDITALPALVEHALRLIKEHPELGQFDLILPVPASNPRPFNPVYVFCEALACEVGKPAQKYLAKTRQTQPQKEMHTLTQKHDNVAGAFSIRDNVSGKRLLVVDDLFDSGATLEEITRLLLQQRAAQVNVLTFTRTIHSDS